MIIGLIYPFPDEIKEDFSKDAGGNFQITLTMCVLF